MIDKRFLIASCLALVSALGIASETDVKLVGFSFERYERPKYLSPELPRTGLTAVVELKNGKVLKAPFTPGGRDAQWYSGIAAFEKFDLKDAKYFGIQEVTPNTFTQFSKITGVRVSAFTIGGEQRVVELPSEVSKPKWTDRNGAKMLPAVDTADAIVPWSEITITVQTGDGLEPGSSLIFQLESTSGETADVKADYAYDKDVFNNNTVTVLKKRVPFNFSRAEMHRIRVGLKGGQTGISTDDIDLKALKIESRSLKRTPETLYQTGSLGFRLGLKGVSWWQSPVFKEREILGATSAQKIFYEIYTASDDLRVDGSEERTRSRLYFLFRYNNDKEYTDSLPTLDQIRDRSAFGSNGTCTGSFTLPDPTSLNRLNFIQLLPSLGSNGSGLYNFLGTDDWDFAGIRFLIVDSNNVKRVIYSNIFNTKLSQKFFNLGGRVDPFKFLGQTKKVISVTTRNPQSGTPGILVN